MSRRSRETDVRYCRADRRILNRLQKGIPFTQRPWGILAGELEIGEDFLLRRVAFLKRQGVIRRISAGFSSRKIGFVSTLIAAKTATGTIKAAVKKINYYPEVTHNYARASEYNIWFTLVAQDKKRIAQIKKELERSGKFERILDLPAVKLFKIDVHFRV
jgi:DNA-binding Lrp family transcriptional regulator